MQPKKTLLIKLSHRGSAWRYPYKFPLLLMMLLLSVTINAMQGQCPSVDSMSFPVDTGAFVMSQDYGERSVRHDGRYHTAEDWFLPDGTSLGQTVRAIANGRVTYSYAQGWGRDGGVVILEHTLPDGELVYSMYGHLTTSDTVAFPAGSACVRAGDTIGVIGDAAPVPHLHFEIRTSNGRTPGAGYTWSYPDEAGYLRPSRFVLNWQSRLKRSVNWVTDLRDVYPTTPLTLNDNSLLVVENTNVVRILPDGRRLWRRVLGRPVHAVFGYQGNSFVFFADGEVQQIDPESGSMREGWRTDLTTTGAPFLLDDALVFPSESGGLVALGADRRQAVWETSSLEIAPIQAINIASQVIGVLTDKDALITLARSNMTVLHRAQLREHAAMTTTSEGTLHVYSQGGLWRILADGVWEQMPYPVSLPEQTGGIVATERGEFVVFDGAFVRNYTREGVEQWAFPLAGVAGRVAMDYLDGWILIYSAGGTIATVNAIGNVCRVGVGGQAGAYLWHEMGNDGVLRVMIGDVLIGIDRERFTRACD